MTKKKPVDMPVLLLLMLVVCFETFSYDSERIVILCILSFLLIAYFNFAEMLYNLFIARAAKLKEEYSKLSILKITLKKKLRSTWRIFLDLEDLLVELYVWVNISLTNLIKRWNEIRKEFKLRVTKDYFNTITKDPIYLNKTLNTILFKDSTVNFRGVLSRLFEYSSNPIDSLLNHFATLVAMPMTSNVVLLIFNKLKANYEYNDKLNKNINNYTFHYIKYAFLNRNV